VSSLTDVAKLAGVSLTTASMVLNKGKQENRVSEACAERVRGAAKQLGYIPNYHARSMKLGRAEVIAVALDVGHFPDGNRATRPELALAYFSQIIGAVELYARNLGYLMTIVGPDDKRRAPDRAYLGLRQRRFDGIVVPGTLVQTNLTSFMNDAPEAPIVVVEYDGRTDLPVVHYDEAAGVRLAVQHLAGLGHRELLWVGDEPAAGTNIVPLREQMFASAVWEAGLRGASCRIPLGDFTESRADLAEAALASYLAAKPRTFTAVVGYNDITAIGVCGALMAAGVRIPQDVSVIGFDNIEASLSIPRLTSVSHKLPEMGTRAAELVMQMINDPEQVRALRGRREVIQPDLVVRKSTGRAPE
jgi:LacI family transcriptional regulator